MKRNSIVACVTRKLKEVFRVAGIRLCFKMATVVLDELIVRKDKRCPIRTKDFTDSRNLT
jgi:hypothetical protein